MGPQPINLDSNARIFGAVIEGESQFHRPFPSSILLLSSANNCMHPVRERESGKVFSPAKNDQAVGVFTPAIGLSENVFMSAAIAIAAVAVTVA